ncbi:TPA: hypothetical protein ACXKGF_005224 [Escherichia coli]
MQNSNPIAHVGPYRRGKNLYLTTVTLRSTCDNLKLVAWFTHTLGNQPAAIGKEGPNKGKIIKLKITGNEFRPTTEQYTNASIYETTNTTTEHDLDASFEIRLAEDVGENVSGVFSYQIEGRLAIP